jgi:creatinine amidohydrolase/Fe(II)-dependent formamide hydrolase-like protein
MSFCKIKKKKKTVVKNRAGSLAVKVDYDKHPTVLDPEPNTYYLPDMTWIEIRDHIKNGRDTLLIVVGGYDNNGPYTVLDKHQLIVKHVLNKLAQYVPILIAPLIPFAPSRDLTSNSSPGTLEISQPLFVSLVVEFLKAYQQQKFKTLLLATDHGGNNPVTPGCLKEAVRLFNSMYGYHNTVAYFYEEFYHNETVRDYVRYDLGFDEVNEGIHDEIVFTSQLMALNPIYVRYNQRKKKKKLSINGVDISSIPTISSLGKKIFSYRISLWVPQIKDIICKAKNNTLIKI